MDTIQKIRIKNNNNYMILKQISSDSKVLYQIMLNIGACFIPIGLKYSSLENAVKIISSGKVKYI